MNILRARRKSKKKFKAKTLLLVVFFLIMTTFAWFAYSKVLNTTLNLHVAAWDIQYFIDGKPKTNPISIQFDALYPAMETQTITVDIKNNGEALVDLDYYVQEITIAGVTYDLTLTDTTTEDTNPEDTNQEDTTPEAEIVAEGDEVTEGEGTVEEGEVAEGEGTTEENNNINIARPEEVVDAETGKKIYKGYIINDLTRFPFTVAIEHSAQVVAGGNAYLTVTAEWTGIGTDDLDTEWGYIVGKYLQENPTETAMSIKLSIDSYQADEIILAGAGTLPSATGTSPYLPSSDYSKVDGTDLTTGLVIEDSSGNEYVWIEVPRLASLYKTAGLVNLDELTGEDLDNAYQAIEYDLQQYATSYRDSTRSDTYSTDELAATNLGISDYTGLKRKMLKSIYKNGGFYIGRHEAGTDTWRTSNTSISGVTALSQANKYPLTRITSADAQTLASKVAPSGSGLTSSLLFGIQWDLTLKYLETKQAATQTQLATSSTSWGNYSSSSFTITNTSARYTTNDGTKWNSITDTYNKAKDTKAILTTSASTGFRKQNILDLAGNVWELTLEYSGNEDSTGTIRGGSFDSTDNNAKSRSTVSSAGAFSSVGFRVSIY